MGRRGASGELGKGGRALKRQDRTPEVYFYEWSVNRWRTSETRARLTMAGRGIYRELLDLCYAQGSVPSDFQVLASMLGCAPVELETVWPQISRHFYTDKKDKNRFRNAPADARRKQFFAYVRTQRENGKSGGRPKAKPDKEIETGGLTQKNPKGRVELGLGKGSELTAALPLPPQQNGDWPETARAVHEHFPDCDLLFIEALVAAGAGTFAGIERPKCAFSDDLVAAAVRQVHKRGQNSAGLFSKTVPACIRTWASEGRPNQDGEIHF